LLAADREWPAFARISLQADVLGEVRLSRPLRPRNWITGTALSASRGRVGEQWRCRFPRLLLHNSVRVRQRPQTAAAGVAHGRGTPRGPEMLFVSHKAPLIQGYATVTARSERPGWRARHHVNAGARAGRVGLSGPLRRPRDRARQGQQGTYSAQWSPPPRVPICMASICCLTAAAVQV